MTKASARYNQVSLRCFTSTQQIWAGKLADHCDLHIVESPFPPIPNGPYPPTPEMVMENWKGSSNSGGYLDKEVAIFDGSTGLKRTFHDYFRDTTGLAGSFKHELDVEETSCVCLFAPNHVDYVPLCLAVGLCGAKLTPVNPIYKANELQVILDRSKSSILIAHPNTLETALEAAKGAKYVKHVLLMTDFDEAPPEGVTTLNSIKEHDNPIFNTIQTHHKETDVHPYLLPYSSGTTGLPKGVCLTHSNLSANLLQCEVVESMGFASNHKLICPLPFFHIYGFTFSALYCAWKGHELITMSGRFDLELFCQLAQEHQPKRAHLVPPIMIGLAKHPMIDNYDLSSIQCIVSAAAPMSTETEDAVKDRIGCQVKQAWGMSELSPIGTLNSDYNMKSASVGPLVSSTYGKIIDENGKSLGPNEPGELVIKGPQVMLGYLDDPDKTQECLSQGGWLRTGDVAYYDEDGYFFITDRIKELIKVRGYQVAPAELEALLLTNDLVADAAVIQIEDEASGELPRAYIVLKNEDCNKEDVEKEIYEWVKERVAPYKRLDGGIVFKDAIPKSASGKILRRLIRDELKQEG